jgi:SynChlorMet cassette protein ScmC
MTTTGPHALLDAPPLRVRISALDETADLVEMLARVMLAGPPEAACDIGVYVHASPDPPDLDDLVDMESPPESWRSYCVRDRVLIRESKSRHVYLCGVPGYPSTYPWVQVRWHLASFIVGGVLTLLPDRLLLIHGALLANGNAGHVLAGPSGSGKSTAAARVPPPWEAMADNMLAAVATGDSYALLPLPTWSVLDADPDAPCAVETGRTVSLAGLWFLEQSSADATAPLGRVAAIQRLAGNTLPLYAHYWSGFGFEDRVRLKASVLKHAARIVDGIPCGVLKAARHGRFWEHLRAG